MEKSVNFEFRDLMEEMLQFEPVDVSAYSPLVLAYIGDCVSDHQEHGDQSGKPSGSEASQRDQRVCAGICAVIYDACHAGTSDRRRTCCL